MQKENAMWQQKAFNKMKRSFIFSTNSYWKSRRYDISCNPNFKEVDLIAAEDTRQTKNFVIILKLKHLSRVIMSTIKK